MMEDIEIAELIKQDKSKTYTIKINGTECSEIFTKNGNNYVSKTKVDTTNWPSIFRFEVIDNNSNIVEHYDYAKLVQQVSYEWDANDNYYLLFAKLSQYEIANERLQSEIEYIAMMSEVDLDN